MIPSYKVHLNDKDITPNISSRLVELSINDNAGVQNDRVSLVLDDREPYIELPTKGDVMHVWIGYEDLPGTDAPVRGLVDWGSYEIDEVEVGRDPARRITVTARPHGTQTGGDMKSIKTRSWEKATYQQVADRIAAEHGLTAQVHPSLANKLVPDTQQQAMSDQAFINMLANKTNSVVKVTDGKLFIGPRALDTSPSDGQPIEPITIHETDLTNWHVTMQSRGDHKEVVTKVYDADAAKEKTVAVASPTAGGNNSRAQVATYAASPEAAQQEAGSMAGQLGRESDTLDWSGIGLPHVRAEARLSIKGLRPGVRDTWLITSITHTLDDSGLKSSGTCEVPK